MEMKHAETAFLSPLKDANSYGLRWFTPEVEVDLCGHATLAAAHALREGNLVDCSRPISFQTRSGVLAANFRERDIELDFPSDDVIPAELPPSLRFLEKDVVFSGRTSSDWFIEFNHEYTVQNFRPDLQKIADAGRRGLIITAKLRDREIDFISRFFAPQSGVDEDPVTGSAHCALGPYWGRKLNKKIVIGLQASRRSGSVIVECLGARVLLRGTAVTTLRGIFICPNYKY